MKLTVLPVAMALLTCACVALHVPATAKPKPKKLVKVWESDTTLRVPESVLYDAGTEAIYVANIDGKADALDGNGFISKMTLDGKITNLRWATGLNAPKGMAIHGNFLYVTDVYRLVQINLATGQAEKTYDAVDPKNAFLNDVTADRNGNVYVTDSRFDKIYRLANDKWDVLMSGEHLNKPNGILADGKNRLLIGATKLGAVRAVNVETKTMTTLADGMAATDGIVSDGKDNYFVSDWNGQVFFVNAMGEKQSLLDTRTEKLNAADIDYVRKAKLLLVPTFFGNKVVAYRVE
ncbi:periplasmic ATP/GTP-binding protein [Fibrella aestuarina BUZ 2]|uniref:Periplasmic ATP/GTP-binding protein n=1 Tax=Fibrella aestuarina BUZ 2 TaxID=1166018 RepID=I0KA18_9BACT|nr:SMP-30/gluconolactonase/LRE family protein [Fibrella aestuarina]CCH00971.1 periplasmic ATP/GTP-binding protein [Fibrella aestuarina BUZ 2]